MNMLSIPYLSAAVLAGGLFLWQLVKKLFPWLPDDVYYLKLISRSLKNLEKYEKTDTHFCTKIIENGRKLAHQKFVLYEDETWTYQEMDRWSNRCARALRELGVVCNDKVGIMMMNEPAFIAMWIACNKLGVTASFLNYNLRQKSLLHCIDISELKVLVIGKDDVLLEAAKQIDNELKEKNIQVFVYGPASGGYESLPSIVDKQPFEDCPYSWRKDMNYSDPICYIFTSGTTGLPKAVKISNRKCWSGAQLMNLCKAQTSDVIYTCIPLYHSSASLIGVAGAVQTGCSIALRKKFSTSQFWPDCRKFNVTIAQYVGETLRYVCNQAETPNDRDHSVRAVVGNGLRPDVWRTFIDRYGSNIHVLEFYAATEGNVGFFNVSNKFGCIGTFTPLFQTLGAAAVVKFDFDTEEMKRSENGRAIYCGINEPGLLVAKISERFAISRYKGKDSLTEKKILHDVFKTGDRYFNTGDLIKFDHEYRVSFCDRIGDTFRWKGENVSTNEVSDTISQAPGVKEVNVYGVEIPGHDGRAGMAAIVPDKDSLDFDALYEHLSESLPAYARPLFLRIQEELEITGTFKRRKVSLKQDGYSLEKCGEDEIYFLKSQQKTYVRLSKEMQHDIENGTIRI